MLPRKLFFGGSGILPRFYQGLIAIDAETQQTEMRGVFAGGDAADGPATVIQAIAAGRRAGFGEVELGCDQHKMLAEVTRCLHCDLEIGLARQTRETDKGLLGGSAIIEGCRP
jgi:pyruvate/2-oxoglutarate dehydrogenase complex dihydrolipoamide dehydrogenase (E3) component